MNIFKNPKRLSRTYSLGFTLIELLISLGIIAFITGVILFNQSNFADLLTVRNTANDISLQIREAQVFGVSVREFSPGTNEFNAAYGVSFNYNNVGASNTSYISFADRSPQNGYYDTPSTCLPGPTSECLLRINLTRGNSISNLCVIQSDNSTICTPTIGRIDITFLRPNPNANIVYFDNSGNLVTYPNSKGAKIELSSPQGAKRYVYVYVTGQISVQ